MTSGEFGELLKGPGRWLRRILVFLGIIGLAVLLGWLLPGCRDFHAHVHFHRDGQKPPATTPDDLQTGDEILEEVVSGQLSATGPITDWPQRTLRTLST